MKLSNYFTDADLSLGDALTYSIKQASGLEVGSWVSLAPTTGIVTYNAGLSNVGWNYFAATVTDKSSSTFSQQFGILVNSKPIINESMKTLYATKGIPFAAKLSKTLFVDPDN